LKKGRSTALQLEGEEKMDKYTKIVLTVIATCLVALVIQNTITNAHATGGVQKVAVCNENGTVCADVYEARWGKVLRVVSP
jgi:glycine cleavage system aminomethyltransferase T